MEDNRKIVCNRCRRFVSISDIKYMPNGKDSMIAICSACRAKTSAETKSQQNTAKPQKKRYFCERCRYKFRFDPASVTNLRCPMCGKKDKITEGNDL